MILAGGGFFGFLIASAVISILLLLAKFGFSCLNFLYSNYKYDTSSLSSITDLGKLKSLLNFWSSGGASSDSIRVEQICNRILSLYPDDFEAKIYKVVFCVFNREYNNDDKIIFENLYELYKKGVEPRYNDDILLSIYLYSYYCSKNDLTELGKELIHDLELKMPDYRIKLDDYIQAYPINY
jgi:hypothetical protein